jgi:hypothetical protein
MTPGRLASHDQDREPEREQAHEAGRDEHDRGSARAGRIESDAQLGDIVQRATAASASGSGGPLDAGIADQIQAARPAGAPLSGTARASAEAATGADLSRARVHVGAKPAELSRAVGARAFTSGRDIFLGAGTSLDDHDVIAHEATHTVQQGMSENRPRAIGAADTAHERAAEAHDARGTSPADTLQRYTDGAKVSGQYARVSDHGRVVVLGQDNYSQALYATDDIISEANTKLASSGDHGSYLRLTPTGDKLDHGGKSLTKVAPVFKPRGDAANKDLDTANQGKGPKDTMSLWADCGRSSRTVMGSDKDAAPHGAYHDDKGEHDTAAGYEPSKYSDEIYLATIPPFLKNPANAAFLKKDVHYHDTNTPANVIQPADAKEARKQYWELGDDGRRAFDKFAHINTAANPHVGGGYTLNTEYDMPGFKEQGAMTWNFHWAGVVMKDGTDNITLENYADGKGYDSVNVDWNFQMYGTVKKGQTFYEQHLASGTHGNRGSAFEVEPKGS